MAALSLIVIASGPERLVQRARDVAAAQALPSIEMVVIDAGSMTPGAARNSGVRRSVGAYFLIVDGSDQLTADYVPTAIRVLDAEPGVAFAALAGVVPFGHTNSSRLVGRGDRIGTRELVGSPWAIGPAIIRRGAFDEAGGFDEALPTLVDWDLLLTLADAGMIGVITGGASSRYVEDDVRLRETLAASSHLPAMRIIFARHQAAFEKNMAAALIERERTARVLFDHEQRLLERRRQALADLAKSAEALASLRPALARYALRTLEFGDLRSTAPVSRFWGSDRGVPVDRHYIHEFLEEHAGDVRGHVLEMLDANLTSAYGGDRVVRSDVLDIDPGNARATLIGDLRAAEELPEGVYDCFILTQTLHLIDDMAAALTTARRVLKPGGVLLVTLPCASMVATEYGPRGDHWRVTEAGARALFERVFSPGDLSIRARGNLLTTTAFLHGLSCDDLDPAEFAVDDPAYPLVITVRARKPAAIARAPRPPEARPATAAAAVLLSHRVAAVAHDTHGLAVSPAAFRAQMEHLLREHWRVVPLRTLAAASAHGDPPDRVLALTFDDGYLDNLETAAPILAELNLPATFFLTAEARTRRTRFWWDVLAEALGSDRLAHDEWYARFKTSAPAVRDELLLRLAHEMSVPLTSDDARPMLDDEVPRLRAFPLIEIGAHTVHHPSLPDLSPEECHREVFESRTALERLTGRPVTSFAYPFGAMSPDTVAMVMAAGFEVAVACDDRGLRTREHHLRIPRLATREETGAELLARLCILRP
jgi:peptidoglycan/xylan/chitin deacetylase (PgdA/CDA1 family)